MDKIFQKWFDGVIKKWEGGTALRPANEDPGGLTRHGVTFRYWQNEAHAYVGMPPTADALMGITWNDAATIAYNGFWLKHSINKISNPALRPIVADAYWLGGGLKSLGYDSIAALNGNRLVTPSKLYGKRMAYLRSLKNWSSNAKGWTNRINDVFAIARQLSRRRMMVAGGAIILLSVAGYTTYRILKN